MWIALATAAAAAAAVLLATAAAEAFTPPPGARPLTHGSNNDFAVTWYSFQDNTPTNSANSSSGRKLVPYVSVAVPFRLLRKHGGPLDYGDKLFVSFLQGRRMPNGKAHTGWVQVDDFCGDSGNDSYCFKTVKGRKVPNVDVWVGDLHASGYDTTSAKCDGPAGSGVSPTKVYSGTPPAGQWVADYGGRSIGPEKCGDVEAARRAHGKCYFYEAPRDTVRWCPK